MKGLLIFILPLIVLFQTCSQKNQVPENVPQEYSELGKAAIASAAKVNPNAGKGEPCCNDQASYIPDSAYLGHKFFPAKHVRVNVHYMYNGEGKNNVDKLLARQKVIHVIRDANNKLIDNCSMNLPLGNATEEFPTQIQMVLTGQPNVEGDDGIYFHDDEELYFYVKRGKNENRPSRKVIEKYGIGLDTILNIFIMPHHPDSVKSKDYRSDVTGIALRNAIKVAGWHANPTTKNCELSKNLNHELGHILNLHHTWSLNDGCDDTPKHPNCWWYTKNGSVCDSLVSNNLMDTNAGKCAITPCQIGRMHRSLSLESKKQRKFLKPLHCDFDAWRSMTILDSVHWAGARDVRGNITIADGAVLMMSCRVSMPATSTITVLPGGKLILNNNRLHNACNKKWGGIKVYKKNRISGEVIINGDPLFEDVGEIDLRARYLE